MSNEFRIDYDRFGGVTLTDRETGRDVYSQPGDDADETLRSLGLDPKEWEPGDWDYLTDMQASIASEYFTA